MLPEVRHQCNPGGAPLPFAEKSNRNRFLTEQHAAAPRIGPVGTLDFSHAIRTTGWPMFNSAGISASHGRDRHDDVSARLAETSRAPFPRDGYDGRDLHEAAP
jgi:hypothetical protein